MYLWRIELAMSDPQIRRALWDCQKMHRLLSGLFDAGRQEAALLYRCRPAGNKIQVYLYSSIPICGDRLRESVRLTGGRDVSDWLEGLQAEKKMGFDLLTMPFKKVYDGEHKNSRRRVLWGSGERLAWLERKAEQNGFQMLSVNEIPGDSCGGIHPAERGGKFCLSRWRYTGTLIITDSEAFQHAVRHGIGPEKAYGLGMLLLS